MSELIFWQFQDGEKLIHLIHLNLLNIRSKIWWRPLNEAETFLSFHLRHEYLKWSKCKSSQILEFEKSLGSKGWRLQWCGRSLEWYQELQTFREAYLFLFYLEIGWQSNKDKIKTFNFKFLNMLTSYPKPH